MEQTFYFLALGLACTMSSLQIKLSSTEAPKIGT